MRFKSDEAARGPSGMFIYEMAQILSYLNHDQQEQQQQDLMIIVLSDPSDANTLGYIGQMTQLAGGAYQNELRLEKEGFTLHFMNFKSFFEASFVFYAYLMSQVYEPKRVLLIIPSVQEFKARFTDMQKTKTSIWYERMQEIFKSMT